LTINPASPAKEIFFNNAIVYPDLMRIYPIKTLFSNQLGSISCVSLYLDQHSSSLVALLLPEQIWNLQDPKWTYLLARKTLAMILELGPYINCNLGMFLGLLNPFQKPNAASIIIIVLAVTILLPILCYT